MGQCCKPRVPLSSSILILPATKSTQRCRGTRAAEHSNALVGAWNHGFALPNSSNTWIRVLTKVLGFSFAPFYSLSAFCCIRAYPGGQRHPARRPGLTPALLPRGGRREAGERPGPPQGCGPLLGSAALCELRMASAGSRRSLQRAPAPGCLPRPHAAQRAGSWPPGGR